MARWRESETAVEQQHDDKEETEGDDSNHHVATVPATVVRSTFWRVEHVTVSNDQLTTIERHNISSYLDHLADPIVGYDEEDQRDATQSIETWIGTRIIILFATVAMHRRIGPKVWRRCQPGHGNTPQNQPDG